MSIVELTKPEIKGCKDQLEANHSPMQTAESFGLSDLTSTIGEIMDKENEMQVLEDFLGPNSEIASQLRNYYSSVQDEPIPEKFLSLLTQLETAELRFLEEQQGVLLEEQQPEPESSVTSQISKNQ